MNFEKTLKRLSCALIALLFLLAPLAGTLAEEADGDITPMCLLLSSDKRATLESITDDSDKTKLSLAAGAWFSLQWKGTVTAQGLYLQWESVPDTYIVEQRDYSGATLWTATVSGGMPQQYITLDSRCGLVLVLANGKGTLSKACLCRAGAELPEGVHDWQEPEPGADLMLLAGQPGDEDEVFSGLLESYALEKEFRCVLVYLSAPAKAGERAAVLDALWEKGIRTLPVFGTFNASKAIPLSTAEGYQASDSYAVTFAVEMVRKYRPLVLVSHGEDGEGGDAVRTEAYRAARQAAALAADVNQFPESIAVYGTWRVKKLYLHGFAERQMTYAGVAYGLVSSEVGEDAAGDDLFEHIDETELSGYVPPEATPTPVITPTPYAPTPTPVAETETEYETLRRGTDYAWYALLALAVVILALVAVLIVRVTREWKRTGVPRLNKKEDENRADETGEPERPEEGKDNE